MKKHIIITLSRGSLVRNILKTGCIKSLQDAGYRAVILVPATADTERLDKDVPGLIWETLYDAPWTKWDYILTGFYKSLGYNRHTRANDTYGIFSLDEASKSKYWFRKIIFKPLSRSTMIKKFMRLIDKYACYGGTYKKIFDTYQPVLVFSTSIVGDTDIEVIKEAQRRKIPVVGMPKSWDNFPKMVTRIVPDKTLVWGERSKFEATAFSGIPQNTITITGASQFDFYNNTKYRISRDEFCSQWGIDPSKKIIIFGSEGKVMKDDGYIAELLVDAVHNGQLPNAHVIIRPHFMHKNDQEKFSTIKNSKHITIDDSWDPDTGFRDHWDYSEEQIKRFTNLIIHADLMVTSVSTLAVDASANDVPVVTYYFDKNKHTKHEQSMRRWYEREHFYHIVESDAVSLAWNPEELISLCKNALDHKSYKQKQRKKCAINVIDENDGKAGIRMAEECIKTVQI